MKDDCDILTLHKILGDTEFTGDGERPSKIKKKLQRIFLVKLKKWNLEFFVKTNLMIEKDKESKLITHPTSLIFILD